ncbi:MAG: hypothetical protein CMJ78_08915 [Planctomycetaceae bacterium]|nr:hypothetical protein [Planctomycetaceae bacterium]
MVSAVGCPDNDAPNGTSNPGDGTGAHNPPVVVDPLFDGWESPAFTIVLTGEQHGYLEPCGCAEHQSGGISRRADLFRQIREKKWPVTGLELGGMIRRSREQSIQKFQTMLTAMNDMNYAALSLGPEEMRLGAPQLIALTAADPENPEDSIPILGANVVFFGSRDNEGNPKAFHVVEQDGVKIGVTAIFGESLVKKTFVEGGTSFIEIQEPAAALTPVVESLKAEKPDLLVLLSHASLSESKALAERFADFDIVLSAGGSEDPLSDNPVMVGDTMLVTAGHKGKYAGVIGYFPDDEKQRLRFELVNLDYKRFEDSPQMYEHMKSLQQLFEDMQLAQNEQPIPHESRANFVGAAKCGECHKKAYAKWKNSKHAHAYESLIRGREGQEKNWISRIHDPECLCCHVTGWEPQEVLPFESGFLSVDETPLLKGQQCENCHGPGGGDGKHVALEELWSEDRSQVSQEDVIAERKRMALDKKTAKKQLCIQCHDGDNSPKFDFDVYWEKIQHPWKD